MVGNTISILQVKKQAPIGEEICSKSHTQDSTIILISLSFLSFPTALTCKLEPVLCTQYPTCDALMKRWQWFPSVHFFHTCSPPGLPPVLMTDRIILRGQIKGPGLKSFLVADITTSSSFRGSGKMNFFLWNALSNLQGGRWFRKHFHRVETWLRLMSMSLRRHWCFF